jgi:hypothetical protein
MTRIFSHKVLITFPLNFQLNKALEIVQRWKPDTINYDIINGLAVIYLTRKEKRINQSVKKLVDAGVVFSTSKYEVPNLTNPDISKSVSSVNSTVSPSVSSSLDEQALRRIIREEYNSNVTDENIRLQEENSKLRFDIIRLQKELERERVYESIQV